MKLRDWRLEQKLTLAKLAERLGVSEVTVSRYENGARTPERDIMGRIVVITDGAVQPNDFFDTPTPQGSPAPEAKAEAPPRNEASAEPPPADPFPVDESTEADAA